MRIPRPQRSQVGIGALVVAALALGQLLHRYLPEPDADRPFLTSVSSDGVHHLRFGDLRVVKVDGASRIHGETSIDETRVSSGLFLRVEFRWTPTVAQVDSPQNIGYGELHDARGRVTRFSLFGDRSVIRCNVGELRVASRCFAVIETDPTTLAGSRLVLGSSPLDERYDSVADIDPHISKADVKAWRKAPTLPAPNPETVGA